MVWGPTNLSPESCSIRNYKRFGDCGLFSPPTDRRCNQMAHNGQVSLTSLVSYFLNKRISIFIYSDSVYYSRFALVDQSASVLLSSYQMSANP